MKKTRRSLIALANFTRHERTAIVSEMVQTMLDVDSLGFGDALNCEGTLHRLAERFGVPFMVLHVLVDGRVAPEDMREWCTFDSRKAVAS